MTKEELEDKAEEFFPLPKEDDFVYGEAYLIAKSLVEAQRENCVKFALYVLGSSFKGSHKKSTS